MMTANLMTGRVESDYRAERIHSEYADGQTAERAVIAASRRLWALVHHDRAGQGQTASTVTRRVPAH